MISRKSSLPSRWLRSLPHVLALFALSAMWLIPSTSQASQMAFQWIASALLFCMAIAGLVAFRAITKESPPFSCLWAGAVALAAVTSAGLGLNQWFGMYHHAKAFAGDAGTQVTAFLGQRNQLATLLCIGILAVALLWTQCLRTLSWAQPLLFLAGFTCILILSFTLVLTASRTGAIQLTALIAVALLSRRAWRRSTLIMLCGAGGFYFAGTALLYLSSIGHQLTGVGVLARLDDANAYSRLSLWSNVAELIAARPWAGYGFHALAYAHYSHDFSGSRFMEMLDHAHNLPLHLAFVFGIPIASALSLSAGWFIWRARPWAQARWDYQLAWGSLLVIGIHSLFEYPLWYGPFLITSFIALWVVCADDWRRGVATWERRTQTAFICGLASAAALVLAGLAFLAFDYHRVNQMYIQPERRSAWYASDPMDAAKKSVFFQNHAKFAELQITALSRDTAPRIFLLASDLVQWSPEPRIIEKLIESAAMLGQDDVAQFHLRRYRIAYPQAYAQWSKSLRSDDNGG